MSNRVRCAAGTDDVTESIDDGEALVFPEKIFVVSMVCSRDHSIDASRDGEEGKLDQLLTAAPGECVVSKPREPLYTSAASHPKLALLERDLCGPGLGVELASLADPFAPDDLAALLPPPVGAPPPGLAPPVVSGFSSVYAACTVGPTCSASFPTFPGATTVTTPTNPFVVITPTSPFR